MGISLRYELVGAGGARCTLQFDDQTVVLTASYLSDALDDLASLAVAVVREIQSSSCSFAEEPGEYRWIAENLSGDRIRLRVLEFDQHWQPKPDEEGKVLLDVTCRARTFAGAVLSELQRLQEELGPAEYARQWRHPFPAERISQLKSELSRRRAKDGS